MVTDSVLDFLQLKIIVYHRDDRQKLFRRLFMQIESEVKCKYLLSCSGVDLSIFLSSLAAFLGATSTLGFINFHFITSLKKFYL